jgi:hypothetical protein
MKKFDEELDKINSARRSEILRIERKPQLMQSTLNEESLLQEDIVDFEPKKQEIHTIGVLGQAKSQSLEGYK